MSLPAPAAGSPPALGDPVGLEMGKARHRSDGPVRLVGSAIERIELTSHSGVHVRGLLADSAQRSEPQPPRSPQPPRPPLRPPIAKVSANLKIHDPKVTRRLGDDITFVIHIPLSIDLLLDLRLDKQRFVVSGDIALR
ncbi:MAG: hypothetical protein JWP83_3797, partial [Mycobacterium sp.]|nr:hypothetical protein [Mycobacterium sp.]